MCGKGKQKLGPISKQGDRYLRRILVVGAIAVLRRAQENPGCMTGCWRRKSTSPSCWARPRPPRCRVDRSIRPANRLEHCDHVRRVTRERPRRACTRCGTALRRICSIAGWIFVQSRRFSADPINKLSTETTFVIDREVGKRAFLFVEYVGDYHVHGGPSYLFNSGGGYRLTDTQQIDFHVAIGLNDNAPTYIFGRRLFVPVRSPVLTEFSAGGGRVQNLAGPEQVLRYLSRYTHRIEWILDRMPVGKVVRERNRLAVAAALTAQFVGGMALTGIATYLVALYLIPLGLPAFGAVVRDFAACHLQCAGPRNDLACR
jgi:hypothetical protein